jgi:hypothetical protein
VGWEVSSLPETHRGLTRDSHILMCSSRSQIVEIFPSQHRAQHLNLTQSQQYDSDAEETRPNGEPSATNAFAEQQHQDILLSMIPGDKSKRSIRIFPASRPNSRSTERTNGHLDGKIKEKASGIFVKMNVNLP